MFNSKESLYINAIKYDTQLKLDYKELDGDNLTKTKNYVHLVDDEILAKDIAHKINISQEEIPATYISTLLINDLAFLVPKDRSVDLDHELCDFNENYNIAIAKTTLFETKHYFNKTGVDFIYSAFHILNLHLEQNVCKNELVVFLFNNRAFLLVLNETSTIVYSSSVQLPSFDDIKESQFYEDDIVGQKLYDELYYLELSKLIEENLSKFYKASSDVFVEKVSILYAIKQLDSDQIDALKEDLLMDVEYHPINIDEEIFELSKDKHQKKSFVKPRKKEKSNNNLLVGIIFVLLVLVAFILYKIFETKETQEVSNIKNKEFKVQTTKAKLPDHINLNDKVTQNLNALFERIPYDVVVNGFIMYENSVKLDLVLLQDDTYIKSLEPELKTLFVNSSISVKDKNKKISQEAIVLANTYVKQDIKYKVGNKKYITDEFLPKDRVTEQLKILLPKDTILKFKKSRNGKFTSFEYYVNTIVNTPNEFFDLIDSINNELYSIQINYPIRMNKLNNKIEIEFVLIFNQPSN